MTEAIIIIILAITVLGLMHVQARVDRIVERSNRNNDTLLKHIFQQGDQAKAVNQCIRRLEETEDREES